MEISTINNYRDPLSVYLSSEAQFPRYTVSFQRCSILSLFGRNLHSPPFPLAIAPLVENRTKIRRGNFLKALPIVSFFHPPLRSLPTGLLLTQS